MVTHSSTLAWKIPWTEELQSMWSLRVRHDWATSLSCIGEGNGNPLHRSCLETPRDREAWWAAVYGVTQSWTQLKQLSSNSFGTALNTMLTKERLLINNRILKLGKKLYITYFKSQTWSNYKLERIMFSMSYAWLIVTEPSTDPKFLKPLSFNYSTHKHR